MRALAVAAAIITISYPASTSAQALTPAFDSTRAFVVGREQTAQVTVTFERPLLLGRQLRDAIGAADAPWRIGTQTPAELRTDTSLQIGDLWLPAGTYSLWAYPTLPGVTLVVSRQRALSGAVFEPVTEFGRVRLAVDSVDRLVEQLNVHLDRVRFAPDEIGTIQSKSGAKETIYIKSGVAVSLAINWDKYRWSVPLTAPDTLRHRP